MIRNAIESDLSAIVEIYNHAIAARTITADIEPVTVESRIAWFHSYSSQYPLWVLERENTNTPCSKAIAGWLGLKMYYGRVAYRSTAEFSLYVAPEFQRQGVGQTLLSYAIDQAPKLDITTLLAVVFAENHPSVTLLKKFGFQQWGYLPQVARSWGMDHDVILLGRKV